MNREDITLNHGNPSRGCTARRGSAAAPTSTQQIALSLEDGVLPQSSSRERPHTGRRTRYRHFADNVALRQVAQVRGHF